MKIALVQTRFKTGDFEFNYKNIAEKIEDISADLIVAPQAGLEDFGGKDLLLDEKANQAQSDMYKKFAANFQNKTILLGDVLIDRGKFHFLLTVFIIYLENGSLLQIFILMKPNVIYIFLQKTATIQ